jgi:ABC-2 type transport system permease protein
MSKQIYKNTGVLTRFMIKKDWIRIPVWLVAITFITLLTASAFTGLYQSDQERQAIAETMMNPAMTAMVGKGYGLDNYTNGAMMAHQMLLFTAITVAIMCILLVTRHTRVDEEDGRIEMIQSLPVGRLSNLSATILTLFGLNVLLAIMVGVGLYALRIESMDLEGSLLYGAALGATGIFFTSITALFAQLSENSRGTLGFSFAVLGVAYLLRAIGDVGNETLSWLSPLGWIVGSEVYVNNYWWPILLTIFVALVVTVISFYLHVNRDLGSGLIPSKPGRNHASPFLQSPLGLAFRLQRTSIISWLIGMLVLGVSYGSVLGDLESFFGESEIMAEMLTPVDGFTLTEQFLTMLMSVISMICTVPAIIMILKLKGEEKKNRTEHLLVRAVSRTKLVGSYISIALIGGLMMLLVAVIGLWSAGAAVMDEPILFGTMFKASMAYLPAMWIMISVSVLLIGFAPKFTGFTYLYLGYSFFVVYLGKMLQLPEWLGNLSPFGHIPQIPVEDMDYLKISLLTILAMVVMVVGISGYNKRDIEG